MSAAASLSAFAALFSEEFGDTRPGRRDGSAPIARSTQAPLPQPATETVAAPAGIDLDAMRREIAEAARRDAEADASRRLAAAAERTADVIAHALAAAESDATARAEQAADAVARAAIGTLMAALPAVCERFGAQEAAAFVRAVLPGLSRSPALRLRVHPDAMDGAEAALAVLDSEQRGRVALAASEELATGDVRIEWEDGAAIRDTDQIALAIADTLAMLGLLDPSGAAAQPEPRRQNA